MTASLDEIFALYEMLPWCLLRLLVETRMAYRVVAIFQILNSSRFFQHRVISIFIQYEGHCASLERGRGSEQDEDNVRDEGGLFISPPFVNASAILNWFPRIHLKPGAPRP